MESRSTLPTSPTRPAAASVMKRQALPGVTGLRRVLVATDFSAKATHAIARVALLPLASGAEVRLLHVVAGAAPDASERRRANEALEIERERLEEKSARETIASVAFGDARTEIIRAARAHGAEIIVLGAHSKRGRFIGVGSTAKDVIRRGSTPVLVVKRRPARRYARPLVALDLSDVSNMVFETALAVVRDHVPLRVVHAYHVPFEGFVATSSSREELEAFRRHHREEARVRIASLGLRERPGRLTTTVRQGEPCNVIAREIARRVADLVVVGTHGRTGLSELFLGSVAQWTIENAPCDVLVGRPERFTLDHA